MSTETFRTSVLLRSEQSDGQVAAIETTVPAGWEGPPLHLHDFDEAFYVLVCTPAGFERRFDRRAAEQAGVDPPPEASKPIPETTVVGPRIGDRTG